MTKAALVVASLLFGFRILALPVITQQPTDQVAVDGETATFSVTASGSGPLKYQWFFNGTSISSSILNNGLVTTVAGNGNFSYSGDGGMATNATFSYPEGIAVDGAGNLFIADTGNDRIRKVGTNGFISTVAGNDYGYFGDGGLATNALLAFPAGVFVDVSGNLFIADQNNQRIRKVTPDGVITTVAGNGLSGYSGDGGLATNASLNYPTGVAVDGKGNLFIADQDNGRIRKVSPDGVITTVAGNGFSDYSGDGGAATDASLNYPTGVAVDGKGNLFIADQDNMCIRQVSTNGIITTVAGNGDPSYSGDSGLATNASLDFPTGVAVDGKGNLFIADQGNDCIRQVTTSGYIATVAGNGNIGFSGDGGLATNATFNWLWAVAVDDSDTLFIVDQRNERIRKVAQIPEPDLILSHLATNNAGNYQVVISDRSGSITSSVITLTVVTSPVIITQPLPSEVVTVSSPAYFSVNAVGVSPLSYQWYFTNTNLQQTAGAFAEMYFGFVYDAVLTNGGGGYTTVPQVVFVGGGGFGAAGYAVISNGMVTDIVVTNAGWDYSSLPTIQIDPPSTLLNYETEPMLYLPSITTNNIGNYFVVISNGYGSITSNPAAVNIPAYVLVWPQDATVWTGGSATFNVEPGGAGPFYFQWLLNGMNIAGATNASFSLSNASINDAGIYTAAVSNNYGGTISYGAVLTVNYISQQPVNDVVVNGGVASVDVAVSGGASYAYQWLFNGTNVANGIITNGIITTVAGSFAGDGGLAVSATVSSPYGVAVDAAGNLFFADQGNQRIRKVATNGVISTVAGNDGNWGYSGDGGFATSATLSFPEGVAVDAAGNLFIADQDNERVRKVSTNGIITTVAGIGIYGYSGDGGLAASAKVAHPAGVAVDAAGNLFIADQGNQRIRKVSATGIITTVAGGGGYTFYEDGIAATNASFPNLTAVAVDSMGNIFIADSGSECVYKVTTDGLITTVAGNRIPGYSGEGTSATNVTLSNPGGLAVDAAGNLFIADQMNQRILEVATNGIITTVAGDGNYGYAGEGGLATNAMLSNPIGLAVNDAGDLFIANQGNNRISEVATNGTISTVVGNENGDGGLANNGTLSNAVCEATDAEGDIFVADSGHQCIRKIGTNGIITTVAGNGNLGYSGDGGWAKSSTLNNPTGVAVDTAGNLFIADTGNNCVRKVATNGIITTLAGNGHYGYTGDSGPATNAMLEGPTGLASDAGGNLFIADQGNQRIREVTTNGIITTVAGNGIYGYAGDGGLATSSELAAPLDVAVDINGNLFIADTYNQRIRKVMAATGIISTFAGIGSSGNSGDGGDATSAFLGGPAGVAMDIEGNLFIADEGNQRIRKVSTNGIIMTVAGNGKAGYFGDGALASNATLSNPIDVVVDSGGNLLVSDQGNNRIRKVATNGIITTVVGNVLGDGGAADYATFSFPGGVTVDSSGNLFIADTLNQRIRKVATTGIITTVAGNGNYGYSGDGGPATAASLSYPSALTVDAAGDLFIADESNQRIRKVTTNGIITTIAGNGISGYFGDGGAATNSRLSSPMGMASDGVGNLFIADQGNNRVRKVGTNGIITTIAGNGLSGYSGDGGLATNAMLSAPWSVAVDSSGNLYIVDQGNHCIREVASNGFITTVAGHGSFGFPGDGGMATNATLISPVGVAVDATGNLFVSDSWSQWIRKVSSSGIITTIAGNGYPGYSGDGGLATRASLNYPAGIAVDAGGNLFIADSANNRIRRVTFSNPNLILNNVTTNNAGNYQIVITDSYGSITNPVALLTIAYPPSIVWQPPNAIFDQGRPARTAVSATGTPPLKYQWWMTDSQESNATAVPVVMNGFVLAATITSGGAGYLTVPTVQITGGSGSGASGTAVVSNRMVSAVVINAAGYGYTNIPEIQMDPPSAIVLANQTNNELVLTVMNSTNIGYYFVVVSNNYGSVTSSIASLSSTRSGPFPFTILNTLGGTMHLQFQGTPYTDYTLQTATNLVPPIDWEPVLTNIAGPTGDWGANVTNMADVLLRFYRITGPNNGVPPPP